MTDFDKAVELPALRNKCSRPLFGIWEGNYLLHRAVNTTPPYQTKDGIEVGAVIGVLNMLCSDYSLLRPKYCAVSFDVPGLNFRHQILDAYKFNDPDEPEHQSLHRQLMILVRLLRLIGFPTLYIQGVESDDVVGALATQAVEHCLLGEEVNVAIMTGDKDICQFVGPRTVTIDTKKTGCINTPKHVVTRFGVNADQIADYLALMGDNNDGIPGLRGVGSKKARELLAEFGSIEGILKVKAGQHGAKWAKLLTPTALADLRMCYRLTRIRTDVNVAKYGPYVLHQAHPRYLKEALVALSITRPPSLVKAQMEQATLAQSGGLFDDSDGPACLVEDGQQWEGLMGRLWEMKDCLHDVATFGG